MGSLEHTDVFFRLGAAVLVGALIGFDRELRGKPAGLRTVALGSAVFVLTAHGIGEANAAAADATSRVIQGIVTGIGFLGAGSIIRGQTEGSVRGAHDRCLCMARGRDGHRLRPCTVAARYHRQRFRADRARVRAD